MSSCGCVQPAGSFGKQSTFCEPQGGTWMSKQTSLTLAVLASVSVFAEPSSFAASAPMPMDHVT